MDVVGVDHSHRPAHRAGYLVDMAPGGQAGGYTLNWQHLDVDRNVEASVAIMHGDAAPMRRMLDELVGEG